MEFTFLGTSAGTPTRARNVTGLALRHGSPRHWYLIDCGEGTQHQLLRTRLSVVQLQAIFITHVHGDHTFGLPGLLASASMSGRTAPLPLIGPPQLRPFLETTLANTDSNLGFELQYINSESGDFLWQDDSLRVTSAPLSHRVPCHAFRFEEIRLERKLLTERLMADGIEPGPHWGQLQKGHDVCLANGRLVRAADYTTIPRPPRRVVVAGDNDTPELLTGACQDAHLLIHEATYTQAVADRVGPWPRHSSAKQVASFAMRVNLPYLILTHFSSRYQSGGSRGPVIEDIAAEARDAYSGGLHLARDYQRYRLDRDLILREVDE
ncbi:ribonuclease Z [Marinobacter zhanjiangensis]|uniref:Ribonuclease Z n=1 Tax=Marinobacter zhanjiangensis TaxID=578215 RepID=A0ABQ3AWB8_9GAMM|nr:ribonuclease Z [Marinobacter zhanjiangensis]GGY69870.1 ribonuclease Z [Marinobacter zhanjiangensis]